jgi:hypothetical protein
LATFGTSIKNSHSGSRATGICALWLNFNVFSLS